MGSLGSPNLADLAETCVLGCCCGTLTTRFTHAGSITITCQTEDKSNDIYQISVTDTGIGIKNEDLSKLFHAFGRLDLGDKQAMNPQGVGLGLMISNELAKNLILPKKKNFGIKVWNNQEIMESLGGTTFSF